MKSLLIVEDEKMIRQGLVTMVKRSGVPVDEVLDCRNGEEALEIMKSRQVDVMFTDICMPKMDGIALIQHMKELTSPPKTVVISGYDDFSYAVEALRGGVHDYILKPIDRKKVYELLTELNELLEKEQGHIETEHRMNRQQFRYVIMNDSLPESELAELEKEISMEEEYRICCCCCEDELEQGDISFLQLCEVNGQSVFYADQENMRKLAEGPLAALCIGISGVHHGVGELRTAYEEALAARKTAFIAGKSYAADEDAKTGGFVWNCAETGDGGVLNDTSEGGAPEADGEDLKASDGEDSVSGIQTTVGKIPGQFVEQFVQQFGTDKAGSGLRQLENYYFLAKRGKINAEELMDVTRTILDQLFTTYKNVLSIDMAGYMRLQQPLNYNDASSFIEDFNVWTLRMKDTLSSEFSDYRNKEKISMAVAYIKENYDKELNMAIVSNYISMNYSLFSLSFKQYTGMNFVNYLKMIRINEAKRLLVETEAKIIDISQKVGYENEKHFMKTFKSVCGVSPSEYRRNMMMGK